MLPQVLVEGLNSRQCEKTVYAVKTERSENVTLQGHSSEWGGKEEPDESLDLISL